MKYTGKKIQMNVWFKFFILHCMVWKLICEAVHRLLCKWSGLVQFSSIHHIQPLYSIQLHTVYIQLGWGDPWKLVEINNPYGVNKHVLYQLLWCLKWRATGFIFTDSGPAAVWVQRQNLPDIWAKCTRTKPVLNRAEQKDVLLNPLDQSWWKW